MFSELLKESIEYGRDANHAQMSREPYQGQYTIYCVHFVTHHTANKVWKSLEEQSIFLVTQKSLAS